MSTALDEMLEEITSLETEVLGLKRAANSMARRRGLQLPFDEESLRDPTQSASTIRPDQFVNFNAPAPAARAFLEMRRRASTVDEVYDALLKGGFQFESNVTNEAKGFLKIALAKDALVRKIENKVVGTTYGLIAWYPDAKKVQDEPKSTKRGKKEEKPPEGDQAPPAASAEEEAPS